MKACFEEDVQFLIQYFIDLGRLRILKGVLAQSKKHKGRTEVRMRSSVFYGLYSVGEINILPDTLPKYLLSQEYSGEHIGRTLRTYKELENSLQTINIYIANIEQEINQQTEKVTDAQDILGQLSEDDKNSYGLCIKKNYHIGKYRNLEKCH